MPFGSEQWMYASGGFYPYEIDQSLRFNDDDTAYLNRTPASAGNRKTWTWSGWVKIGDVALYKFLFAGGSSSSERTQLLFFGGGYVRLSNVSSAGSFEVYSDGRFFRDPSAWYHVVLSVDTTQASASNRARIYINGSDSVVTTTSWPSQNQDLLVNSTAPHYVGREVHTTNSWDGYMAEVNFIDGQALDPTDFGEFKSGVWIPKSYSGTYGTNGFYLDFGNSGSLGADSSGNGNNWTPTNLAATDQVLDSPTNNFATLNPLQTVGGVTLSEGNLVTATNGAALGSMTATFGASTGKWYFESCSTFGVTAYPQVGLTNDNPSDGELYGSANIGAVLFQFDGKIYTNNGSGYVLDQTTTGTSSGDVVGVAFDLDNQECSFFVNNTQVGTTVDISYMSSDVLIRFGFAYYSANLLANFGQDSSFAGQKTAQGNTDANGIGDFYYAPPAGYLALCTANLPDPVIDPAQDDVPEDYFNTVLYTGNGSTQSITGVGFQPDFVWLKSRSQAYDHGLVDAVRGVTKFLESNTADSEATVTNYTTSFDSDGFSLGVNNRFNQASATNVAWNWKADGTGVTNTDGSITSTVSANQKAGFSIVSYTGNQTNGATVGHGLTQKPDMIISKSRGNVNGWPVYHKDIGATHYLRLNETSQALSSVFPWNNTEPTASVFTLNANDENNTSGQPIIAYCFHSVDGYSKFGSYTGNGSTDGPFVYTGFRPAFVMIKRTDSTGQWSMWDAERNTYNVAGTNVWADSSEAEVTSDSAYGIDLTSNGFKLRNTHAARNASGGTYIYMAFAEMPFKYSNAR